MAKKGVASLPLSLAPLPVGGVLGDRYEILELLGEGGMGSVYKAKDRELDRVVALKVIRPELAARPEVVQRFKQELILARQVTHKNVIRIFDLGEADGTKFITMQYVEGQDLKTLLHQRGKFTPAEAVALLEQVCRALDAAHAEGVVHRDLKPQNILVDPKGKVVVMDFGIARSLELTGLTQTGALVGTLEYMSPEQAKGERVDARSDIFSLGIIFYELLTGKSPYQADTSVASLLKRTQERAVPPIEVDPAIPRALNDVVLKCLQTDPALRYQTALEILQDLTAWQAQRPGARAVRISWKWAAVLAGLFLLAGTGVIWREKIFVRAPAEQKPVTLLLADFENVTGESVFDGTLEPALNLALEGATFISSFNRAGARRIGQQLQPSAPRLDGSLARLVAVREGVNVVVNGSVARQGEGYKIGVTVLDTVTGKQILSAEAGAPTKQEVLGAVAKLAARVRQALGDTTPESSQFTAAETFTAASLEAAHKYALAQELQLEGKYEAAIQSYSEAIQLDSDLGRAYAGLAVLQANLGRREEAEKYFQLAMARIDRMTDREKYRTRGAYYLANRNFTGAIAEYSALVERYPVDTAGHANLALAYFYARDMARALEHGRRAIEIYPKNAAQRNNVALYALHAGDFATAAREAGAVLEINPAYEKAYVALALAQVGEANLNEAAETYRRLEAVSVRGASWAATGLADLALYEGRLREARDLLEKGLAADLANKNTAAAAYKLVTLAHIHLTQARNPAALAAADRAVILARGENILFPAATLYLRAGQVSKALKLAEELGARLQPEPQAYAKLIQAEAKLQRGNAREAVPLLLEAQKLDDGWLARFYLGRAYLEAKAFTEAYTEFETCLKRRGEASAVFRDDVPSFSYLPPVYYYLGRAQEGLQSPAAADSYRTFLAIKEKSEADPLVAEARRLLGSR